MLQFERGVKGLSSMNERYGGMWGRPGPLRSVPDLEPADEVHLGKRLRAVRERVGLTQEKAAVTSGMTRKALADLEKARFPNPKLRTLLRLMRTYELRSIEELLGPIPSLRLAVALEEEGWQATEEKGGNR